MPITNTNRRSRKAQTVVPIQDDLGRLQPQEPKFEQAILGALMIEKEAFFRVSDILRPTSFYEHRHQLIYSAIQQLYHDERPVDILTVQRNSTGKAS